MQRKRCTKCEEVKSISAFWKNRRTPDGVRYWCIVCTKEHTARMMQNSDYATRARASVRAGSKRHHLKHKNAVLDHYGRQCRRCGFTDLRALSVDHIAGNGAQHRREIGGGNNICRWLVANMFPSGFQILCMNCQMIKRAENGEVRKAKM
jgi:hypothetical protein